MIILEGYIAQIIGLHGILHLTLKHIEQSYSVNSCYPAGKDLLHLYIPSKMPEDTMNNYYDTHFCILNMSNILQDNLILELSA